MRLHQVRAGQGTPPIVFVHGMGSSSATWAECMGLLHDRFLVVAVDLLGHGASPVPDDPAEYTRDRALDDLSRAARAMRDLAETLEQQPDAVLRGRKVAP